MQTRLIATDFDGTLTTRDTLVEFIRFTHGTFRCLLGFLLIAPLIVLMKLHLYPSWKAKQRLFAHFYRGMTMDRFRSLGTEFAETHRHLLRPRAEEMLRRAEREGTPVIVVTASIDLWVAPFFAPGVVVLGTQAEADAEGVLTGRFLTPNCRGEEKVRRLQEHLPRLRTHRADYHITAYGDSSGDTALLRFADEGRMKPFE